MPRKPPLKNFDLFKEVRATLRPPKDQQLFLTGIVKPKKPITKEDILHTSFERLFILARKYADEKQRLNHRISYQKALKDEYIRELAKMYSWPEVFDGRRGFVSGHDVQTHKHFVKRYARKEPFKGVETALQRIAKQGFTLSDMVRLTKELLTNHIEDFYRAQLWREGKGNRITEPFGRSNFATRAAQIYAESIKPALIKKGIIPPNCLYNEDKMAAIDHNIIFMLYLGMEREWGQRQVEKYKKKLGSQATPKEMKIRKAIERKDVKEELQKGEQLDYLIDALPPLKKFPTRKPKNRFR